MSFKNWEQKVLRVDGAAKRVAEIEDELRLAAGLTALRERAGVSQRQLAEQMGVSQPRMVAIEKSKNVTIEVLDAYVSALGGRLEVSVVRAGRRTRLLGAPTPAATTVVPGDSAKSGSFNALNHRSRKGANSAESAEKPKGKTLLSGTKGRKPTDVISLPR
jgi:transcriptional regulator with XRE-family HTH domain